MATITISYEEYLSLLDLQKEVEKLKEEKVQLAEGKDVLVKHIIKKREEDMAFYEYDGISYYEQIPKQELYKRLHADLEICREQARGVERLKNRNWFQRLFDM